MKPREIDALIATHLFNLDATKRDVAVVHALGINNCHETRIYDIAAMPWALSGGKQAISMWVVPGGPGDYQEIERYSTTGGGMMEVVEAVLAREWDLIINTLGPNAVNVAINKHAGELVYGAGKALPMAVALACLSALGVEVAP